MKVHDPILDLGCSVTPNVSFTCDTSPLRATWPDRHTLTYVGRYPVLPYLLAGAPVTVHPTPAGWYWSRFLTTLTGAVFLATAVALAITRRRPFLLLGVLASATPAVIAGLGVLSSTPLEITSAILLWTSVALLVDGERPTARFVALAAGSAAVLAVSRPVSFLWAGVACLALLLLLRPRTLASMFRLRAVKVGGAVTMLGIVTGLAWYLFFPPQVDPAYLPFHHLSYPTDISSRVSAGIAPTQTYWLQAIGGVGYQEYLGPWWVTLGWTVIIAAIVGTGALFAGPRRRVTMAMLAAIVVLLPVAVQAYYLPTNGPHFWWGRYDLPLLAGLILLAAAPLDKVRERLPELGRLGVGLITLCGVLQLVEFAGALRRYTVSTNGNLNPLDWASGWRPPIPSLALLGLMVITVLLTYGWWAREFRWSPAPSSEEPVRLEAAAGADVAPDELAIESRPSRRG